MCFLLRPGGGANLRKERSEYNGRELMIWQRQASMLCVKLMID